jgi:REP element-mobilizing transposase RayT
MSMNNRRRWAAPWKDSRTKPAIYHCISRVVDRRFVIEADEREHFRMLMRMCEKFTGCRVLSYCVMSNHFHLLLEVPPMPEDGISDAEFFTRLRAFYSEAQVADVAKEMKEAAARCGSGGSLSCRRVMKMGIRSRPPRRWRWQSNVRPGAWRKSAADIPAGCMT